MKQYIISSVYLSINFFILSSFFSSHQPETQTHAH